MDVSLFDYHLPLQYIAQEPLKKRDQSRLMVLNKKTGAIEHKKFFEIINYLNPGDLLVLNDSKVIPVRLFGHKNTGGKVGVAYKFQGKLILAGFIKTGQEPPPGTEILFSHKLA